MERVNIDEPVTYPFYPGMIQGRTRNVHTPQAKVKGHLQ